MSFDVPDRHASHRIFAEVSFTASVHGPLLTPLAVQSSLQFATAIQSAAGLGFLGLGAQPPTAEWGAMLADSRVHMRVAPMLVAASGLAIMIATTAFNLLGDGLRDALDVRLRTP